MAHIILTEEQTNLLETGAEAVEIHAPDGRVLGVVRRLDAYDLEALRRFPASRPIPQRTIPSARIQAFLQKAQEIAQQEGMTREKMDELLRKLRSGEEL